MAVILEPLHKMATSLEFLHNMAATPETHPIVDAKPESRPVMATTPQSSVITDATPVFLVIVSIAFEDTQAFQRHLGLISSLTDPLLVSARAAGIPRALSLSVPESAPVQKPPELTPVYESAPDLILGYALNP